MRKMWCFASAKTAAGASAMILTPCPYHPITAAGASASKSFITISSDRLIIKWNLDTLAVAWQLPTIGGHIYALDFSPVDPGTLAIGDLIPGPYVLYGVWC